MNQSPFSNKPLDIVMKKMDKKIFNGIVNLLGVEILI